MARFEQLERREVLSGAPLQATYEFVVDPEPDAYDPASQFTLTTEYVGAEATPRAVLSLRTDLTEEARDIALQEIEIELRSGDAVLQTQSILVDIAEADFVNEFSGDRRLVVQGVLEDAVAVPPASQPDADIPLEELLDVAAFEAKRRSGEADAGEAAAFYTAFRLALEEASDQQDSALSAEEYEQAFRDSEALASAGLLLTGRLRQDTASPDSTVSAAAAAASEALGVYGGSFYTIFSGLGGTHEIAREENYGGAEAFVLAIVEEPVFEATDSLRVELGDQPAMVQAYVVDGTLPSLLFASLQTPVSVTKDTYVNSALPSTKFGSANPLVVEKSVTDESHAVFSIDLDGVASLLPSSAAIALQATQVSGSPTHEIQAHYDFWDVSGSSVWDEATLDWNLYSAQLDSGFRTIGQGSQQTITATGSVNYDVTEAVQRALLAGDANADGLFDAKAGGIRSDIEAAYLAVRDPAHYAAEYAGNLDSLDTLAGGGKDYLYRNDLNWDGAVTSADFSLASRRLDVLGDFNLDGTVDGADYSVWQANYGIKATRFQDADANADGAVDAADYTAWNDGEAVAGTSNPYDGTARAKAVTFRVVPISGTSASYEAPSGTGLIVDSTASRIVQTHAFNSQPGSQGWEIDYEVLHESGDDLTFEVWQTPIIDDIEGTPSRIYSSGIISQSGGVNGRQSHSIPPSAINLDGVKEDEYRLEAKVISGISTLVSSRYFEGGMFYDKDNALHIVGNELDNSVEINSSSAWLRLHTGAPSTYEQIQFGSGSPIPSHVYFQTGAGDDQLLWYGYSQVDASFVGGLGDDAYKLLGVISANQSIKINDRGGFDTLEAGDWVTDLDQEQVLDLRSTAQQSFNISGQFVLDLELTNAGAVQFLDEHIKLKPSGPGYDGGPLVVDSLDSEFDGQLGEDQLELREAIEIANRVPGAQEIQFAESLFIDGHETIFVGSDPRRPGDGNNLEILDELVINGPGSEWLTLDAEGNSRIFLVQATAEIHGLTGKNGQVNGGSNGGAIAVTDSQLLLNRTAWIGNGADGQLNSWAGGAGGAVYALRSDLTVLDSTFDDNTARWGGAIYARPDGGEEIVIAGSTLSNNNASVINGKGGKGSAINIYSFSANAGSTFIGSTTISGNHGYSGPAVYIQGHGGTSNLSVEIAHSTLTDNAALVNNYPAGLWNNSAGITSVVNSIIAHNVDHLGGQSESDYDTRGNITFSRSLVGVAAANSTSPIDDQDGNIVLDFAGNETAGLLPLGDYGGPVETHALRPNSIAIDNGDASLNPQLNLWDQRGPRFQRELGDSLDIGAVEASVIETIDGQANTVKVLGSDGDDIIFTSAAGVYLDWQGGYAFPITTGSQTDLTIEAGYGDDIVFVEASLVATTTLRGEEGADQLHGGGGTTNKLVGGEGADTVHIKTPLNAVDEIFEGLGNDTYVFGFGTGGNALLRTGEGETAEGIDTLDFSALTSGVTLDLTSSTYQTIGGLGLLIDQTANNPLIENVVGTSSIDDITGNDLDNTLIGGDGDDILNGGDGRDELVGEAGMDELNGGTGEDLLHGGDDADTLMGGPDNDQLVGGDGNDTLDGGDGVDSISGGLGVDTFEVDPLEDYQSDLLSDPDGTPAITDGSATNSAPTFGALPSQVTLTVDVPYELQLTADSGDFGQSVAYGIESGTLLPPSASLSPEGLLKWTPTAAELGTSTPVSFVAADVSSLPLTDSATTTFLVTAGTLSPIDDFSIGHAIANSSYDSELKFSHAYSGPGAIIIEERASNALPGTPWRQVAYRSNAQGWPNIDVPFSDFVSEYGLESARARRTDFRAQVYDSATGMHSPYAYVSAPLSGGTISEPYLANTPSSAGVSLGWLSTAELPESVDVYSSSEYTPDSPPVFLGSVPGTDLVFHDTRPYNSSEPPYYLLQARTGNVSTDAHDVRVGFSDTLTRRLIVSSFLPSHPEAHLLSPNLSRNFTETSQPGTAGSLYIGYTGPNEAPPAVNHPGAILELNQSGVFVGLGAQVASARYTFGSGVTFGRLATRFGELITVPVTSGDIRGETTFSQYQIAGIDPSAFLGEDAITIEKLNYHDSSEVFFSITKPVTVVDIDLEVQGLDSLAEDSGGAVIQLNNDFSKGLTTANGKLVPDNQRDPSSGAWLYDSQPQSRLVPATLRWNAQAHQELPIMFSHTDDIVVWNVTGGIREVLANGKPFYANTDGLDLMIEGVGRSDSWAATSIKAEFLDPYYVANSIDADEVKYTVVDFTALVDGDRDGEFKADDSDDRSLSFWYNTDVDRVRFDNASWFDMSFDPDVPSDVSELDYRSRLTGETVSADWVDRRISSVRDLEDFFVLRANVDRLVEQAPESVAIEYYVTLDDTGSIFSDEVSPWLQLYDAGGVTSSTDHLFGENRSTHVGQIARHSITDNASRTPSSELGSRSRDNFTWLVEARPDLSALEDTSGEGLLRVFSGDDVTLTLHAEITVDGEVVNELASSVDLRLRDVSRFYDTYVVDASSSNIPGTINSATLPDRGSFSEYSTAQSEPTLLGESEDYLLNIHGWNNSEEDKRIQADTVAKRLFWQGYSGRIGTFNWPTFVDEAIGPDSLDGSYNPSEFNAFRSGLSLKNLLEEFKQDGTEVDIIAHSMGNIVTNEALRLWDIDHPLEPLVDTYIAAEAAVHRDAFDGIIQAGTRDLDGENFFARFPAYSSESLDVSLFALSESAATKWVNIYNDHDNALEYWGLNNRIDENQVFVEGQDWLFDYDEHWFGGYYRSGPTKKYDRQIHLSNTPSVIEEDYELLAFFGVSQDGGGEGSSTARPLGRAAIGGRFEDIDLSTLGYSVSMPGGNTFANHSFQYLYDTGTTAMFWEAVVSIAGLTTSED